MSDISYDWYCEGCADFFNGLDVHCPKCGEGMIRPHEYAEGLEEELEQLRTEKEQLKQDNEQLKQRGEKAMVAINMAISYNRAERYDDSLNVLKAMRDEINREMGEK